ncbi:hypothetical protein [Geobacillus thermodenitrificans]|uniref:hypothetical protein n=1 Tax=Geobacillus thermodenitrificans TaxID=33940 RepID=UPI000B433354|nr:hypothetical protein [Geobacillus thermodenitrificans]
MPASLLFLPIAPTPSDTVNSQKRQLAAPIILLNQNIQDSISPFYFHTLRLAVMIFTQKSCQHWLAGKQKTHLNDACHTLMVQQSRTPPIVKFVAIVYCKIKIQSSATKSAELKAKKKRLASL